MQVYCLNGEAILRMSVCVQTHSPLLFVAANCKLVRLARTMHVYVNTVYVRYY